MKDIGEHSTKLAVSCAWRSLRRPQNSLSVLVVLAFFLLAHSCLPVEYARRLDQQAETWYVDSFYVKRIEGTLRVLVAPGTARNEVVLTIGEVALQMDNSYGLTCVNEDFLDRVHPGMVVLKPAYSTTMQFWDASDSCCSYDLDFCGEFENVSLPRPRMN